NGYNGLPIYSSTGIKLVDTTAIGTNTIKFKIGAKASNTQAAGEYTNTVNFTAVGKATPVSFYDAFKEAATSDPSITMLNGYYKMQDMSNTICNNVYTSQLTDNSDTMEAQLIDIRDNNVYWVAKLKDGHCWMTQNLDLNLDKDVALTSNDTDLVEYGINGYVDGYSCSNDEVDCDGGVISWIPERSTINAVTDEIAKITWLASWGGSPIHPYSVDSGNWYWVGTDYNSKLCWPGGDAIACSYMWKKDNVYANYFSNRSYTGVDTSKNGEHGSVGNYYNWSASIASNDSSVYIDSTYSSISNNPENSVCPLGWRLSRIASYESGVIGSNEIYNLVYYYGGSGANLIVAPLYLVRSGTVWGSSGNGYLASAGYTGRFWTSTVSSDTKSYIYDLIDEVDGGLNVAAKYNRLDAVSVRCLAR
ncbi:hypothetical protein IKG05_01745, partial [Candidatus Saccharibacteria bacterium]|nr:hypothetical protein [Candidatus Saccharibacteria bacterium]